MKPIRAAVVAPDGIWNEIAALEQGEWVRVSDWQALRQVKDADALFYLNEETGELTADTPAAPLFIHAVSRTMEELPVKGNACRINAWTGFLQRSVWEVSGPVSENHKNIMTGLGKEFVITPDEPGFVSARVLSMIINEAYFALEEKVSSKKEIDIALRPTQRAKEFALALYRAYFAENRDISIPDVTADIAATLGLNRDEVLAAINDAAIKDTLRREVDAAIARATSHP